MIVGDSVYQPHGDAERGTSGEISQPDVLHVAQAGIGIAAAAGEIGGSFGNRPTRERRGGGDDEEAWVGAKKVGEMLHQELAEFLRLEEVGAGRVAGDGQEDFGGWS